MTVDERLRDVGAELDRLADAHEASVERAALPARGRTRVTLAVGLVAVLVVGVLVLGTRWRRHDAGGPSTNGPTTMLDRSAAGWLLPPSNMTDLKITSGQAISALTGRFGGSLRSPSGALFGLGVLENFNGSLPTGDTRTIGGRDFRSWTEMEQRVYGVGDACSMYLLTEVAARTAWNDEAAALLAATTAHGGALHVSLPVGWQRLGDGPLGEERLTSFTARLNGTATTFELTQMRGASLGVLLAPDRGPIEATTVDGNAAWFVRGASTDGSTWTYLFFEHAGDAVMLGGRMVSDADLLQLAHSLVPASDDAWTRTTHYDAGTSGPSTSILSPTTDPNAPCPPRSLTVTTG
jgi:hypothetical protein